MIFKKYLTLIAIIGCFVACSAQEKSEATSFAVTKTDAEWKKQLTAEEYEVLREKGTERAGTGDLNDNKEYGVYTCAACSHELFSSEHKYESGSGWPAFDRPIKKKNVKENKDASYGMVRVEIVCSNCGGHLGHMFEDGPRETTGQRYCINSVSLNFKKEKKTESTKTK